MWYTSKEIFLAKLVMWTVTIAAVVALFLAFNAFATSRQTQQGVVDQCNIISQSLGDQTLRDYCTLLYHKYNRGG
jgi:uncharacterized membrane protein affecting hemolysin expression